MTIMIKVEAMPGDRIEDTIKEMMNLTRLTNTGTTCKFNGVPINVFNPQQTAEDIRKNYDAAADIVRAHERKKRLEAHSDSEEWS